MCSLWPDPRRDGMESPFARSRARRCGCLRRLSRRAGSRSRRRQSWPAAVLTSVTDGSVMRGCEHFGDHARLDERQIALHVDQDLARQVVRNLRDAIGAGPVCRLRSSGRCRQSSRLQQRSVRRQSRRPRRRSRARRPRGDRRARSSDGPRSQRAACQEVSKRRIGRG